MTEATGKAPDFRYRAFISYSHADKRWGDWLHRALETYHIPKRLVGKRTSAGEIPLRLAPIFRNREELSSAADLNAKVNEALQTSANLIVICSPRPAKRSPIRRPVIRDWTAIQPLPTNRIDEKSESRRHYHRRLGDETGFGQERAASYKL